MSCRRPKAVSVWSSTQNRLPFTVLLVWRRGGGEAWELNSRIDIHCSNIICDIHLYYMYVPDLQRPPGSAKSCWSVACSGYQQQTASSYYIYIQVVYICIVLFYIDFTTGFYPVRNLPKGQVNSYALNSLINCLT